MVKSLWRSYVYIERLQLGSSVDNDYVQNSVEII